MPDYGRGIGLRDQARRTRGAYFSGYVLVDYYSSDTAAVEAVSHIMKHKIPRQVIFESTLGSSLRRQTIQRQS